MKCLAIFIFLLISFSGIACDVKLKRFRYIKTEDFILNENLFYVKNIVCTFNNCPPPSFCVDNNTCKCADGFVNYNENKKSLNIKHYCQYKQKKQLVALLLEFFISMGIGHFYANRTTYGLYKLGLSLIPFLITIFLCCYNIIHKPTDGEGLKNALFSISCLFICIFFTIQLIDIINFLTNSYYDGNGVPLESIA